MALPFLESGKNQKYIKWVFLVVILIGVIWFGRNYLVKPLPPSPLPPKEKKIEINFNALKNPAIQNLQVFEEIPPYKGEIGRDNPFLPY